jgi:hypothetical protein
VDDRPPTIVTAMGGVDQKSGSYEFRKNRDETKRSSGKAVLNKNDSWLQSEEDV